MRKLFYGAILLFAVYFTFTHLSELQLIVDVLGQGDVKWLLVAVGVQLIWLVNIAAAFQSTYHLVGVNEHLRHLVPLTAAANFINVVAPSYGLGALAVLIADGQRRSKPAAKVSTAVILYIVYDYLGFMIVLALGLIIMTINGVLDTVLIIASALAILITAALVIFTAFGIQSAKKLGHAVLSLSGITNRVFYPVIHRNLIDSSRAQSFASDFSEGLQHIRHSTGGLLTPGILALTRKVVMMIMLYLVSVAYHHPLELDTLIAGFCTSYLFTIASITPAGVGFVEGALTLYLTALGVPLTTSAAISVAYRGLTFWLVLAYGTIAIRWVGYPPAKMIAVGHASANPTVPRGIQNTQNIPKHQDLYPKPRTSENPDFPASASSPPHKSTSS